jgi:hypothetical protein
LIKEFGANQALPGLRDTLAADCSRQQGHSIYDRCGAYYPQLPRFSVLRGHHSVAVRLQNECDVGGQDDPYLNYSGTRTLALCVTSVAARHLAPSTIKDDVSHELQITNKRVWYRGRVLDHRSGPFERVKQLIGIDSFDEKQPVVRGEILDGKFHEFQHRALVCMGQLEPGPGGAHLQFVTH